MGVTAKGDYPGVILGIAVAAAVAFFVAGALFGFGTQQQRRGGLTDVELTKAEESVAATKARERSASRRPQRAAGGLTRAEHRGQ